jgi:hypothetical protein
MAGAERRGTTGLACVPVLVPKREVHCLACLMNEIYRMPKPPMIKRQTLCEIDRLLEGPTSSGDGVRIMFSDQATPRPLDSPGIKANEGGNAQEPGRTRGI